MNGNSFLGGPLRKKGRLSYSRGLDQELSHDSSILEISFSRAVTSTPIPFAHQQDFSFSSTVDEEPLDLSMSSKSKADEYELLDLVLPKVQIPSDAVTDRALDLRTVKIVPAASGSSKIIAPRKVTSHTVSMNDFSAEDSRDPDWCPDTNSQEDQEDDELDGDPTMLNDLTIYEYFEHFRTQISDDDADDSSDDETDHQLANVSEKNGNQDQHELATAKTDLQTTKLLITENDNSLISSHEEAVIEVTDAKADMGGHCIDDIEKETIYIKKRKISLRKVNKECKEKGLQYVRKDGTLIPERKIGANCNCRFKCSNKFDDKTRSLLLKNFLGLKLSGQNQFLSSHMFVTKTIRPQVINSRRAYSRAYKLPGVEGTVKVCKSMFMSTFDVGDRKLRTLAAKQISGKGIAADDGRIHNNSHRIISEEHLNYIKQHILSFPAYTSHYTREKSDRMYLSSDLSVLRLYELYQSKCSIDNLIPVCYNSYRLIFKKMNLSFRKPKADTCGECDRFRVQIKTAIEEVEKAEIKRLNDEHQRAAQRVYDEKKKDVASAKNNPAVRTVSFDLQKQLPTPHLSCGQAFYARQLYTLNLTTFETHLGENMASCYMWDETKARRGSQEIGSCLLRDLRKMPSTVSEANYYSDRCAGQNQNRYIVYLFHYFVEQLLGDGRSISIEHKFMKTGHSHMEVDTVHAAIERAKKKTTIDIETPHDWAIFVSAIRRSVPFHVVEMEQKDFVAIKDLDSRYIMPKTTTTGQKFRFKDVMVFRYSTENIGIVQFKYDVGDESFQEIQILNDENAKRGWESLTLKPITTQLIELPTAKLKDLRNLLPYIKQKNYYESFLKNLVPAKRGRKAHSNLVDHFEADMDHDEECESE